MYRVSVYVTPEDILNRLSEDDKKRFNRCAFTDVHREQDGSITIDCVVFNNPDAHKNAEWKDFIVRPHRQHYFSEDSLNVE